MDSVQRILLQMSKHKGSVTLKELSDELDLSERFLMMKVMQNSKSIYLFNGKTPQVMLTPGGWAEVNAIKKEED